MSMMKFIGRAKETDGLRHLLDKRSASLVVIRGRRRIGKSRLLSEFTKYFDRAYVFSGLAPEKNVTSTYSPPICFGFLTNCPL